MTGWSDWFLLQTGFGVYLLLTGLLLGGAIGLPIPEDLPLILAGVLVHHGNASLELVLAVSYLSILAGDLIIYGIGYHVGPALFRSRWLRGKITPERAERMNRRLEKHSLWMIFVARHLFYLRTATFLTCGAFRMKVQRFLIADALAAFVSVPIMVGLGYFLSEHFEYLLHAVSRAKTLSLIIGLFLGCFLLYLWNRRRCEALGVEENEESAS